MTDTFRCFLIGADNLLMECGDILREQGHTICGVISDTDRIVGWAQRHALAVLSSRGDAWNARLRAEPYDYLFAITHLAILPDDVLSTPGKLAVNFHDGPLPRYAGLNTPAWALMNREARYGISWHIVEPGIDTGDLLEQRLFDVAPDETSLSINTRCFEAGVESFRELIPERFARPSAPWQA